MDLIGQIIDTSDTPLSHPCIRAAVQMVNNGKSIDEQLIHDAIEEVCQEMSIQFIELANKQDELIDAELEKNVIYNLKQIARYKNLERCFDMLTMEDIFVITVWMIRKGILNRYGSIHRDIPVLGDNGKLSYYHKSQWYHALIVKLLNKEYFCKVYNIWNHHDKPYLLKEWKPIYYIDYRAYDYIPAVMTSELYDKLSLGKIVIFNDNNNGKLGLFVIKKNEEELFQLKHGGVFQKNDWIGPDMILRHIVEAVTKGTKPDELLLKYYNGYVSTDFCETGQFIHERPFGVIYQKVLKIVMSKWYASLRWIVFGKMIEALLIHKKNDISLNMSHMDKWWRHSRYMSIFDAIQDIVIAFPELADHPACAKLDRDPVVDEIPK